MSTSMMEKDLSLLLEQLEFIAGVQQGWKLSIGEKLRYIKPTLRDRILRTIKGESRCGTIDFINDVLKKCEKALMEYAESDFYKLIVRKLISARAGIKNLIDTYSDDPQTKIKLGSCLENMNILIPAEHKPNLGIPS